MASAFSYEAAFDRNIGWVTEAEQRGLRGKKIAIAGMGGVGGVHLLTLVRLGIGRFHIADFDRFDIANFNRQVGATMTTVGQPKVDVMARAAREINPELAIERFPDGVTPENIDAFLDDVDLFVDGFDFFALDIRAKVFARCRELGIPAITAAPIGLSTGYLVFLPGHMTFEAYFRLEGLSQKRQYVNFFLGLVPNALQRGYLVDPSRLNLAEQRGPSSPSGVQLCAGVVAAEALKILLGRGPVKPAPHYHQFDAYTGRWVSRRLIGGNRNPIQRRKLAGAYKVFGASPYEAASPENGIPAGIDPTLAEILDLARWAPSGDNSQPWRFDVRAKDRVEIRIEDSAIADNVYEYGRGQPSYVALGGLLETIRIAASAHGLAADWEFDRGNSSTTQKTIVRFARRPGVARDPLLPFIVERSVDRRPYRTRPLDADARSALTAAVGDDVVLRFYEGRAARLACARLNAMATDIRLRIPETVVTHQKVVDWQADYSERGIPAAAINLDAGTRRIMRWALDKPERLRRLNRMPGATHLSQVQMDFLPGLACAAHFTLAVSDTAPSNGPIPRLLQVGAALQRLWLTATQLGLVMQPSFAPLCFAHYAHTDEAFTVDQAMQGKAKSLHRMMEQTLGKPDTIMGFGRIGYPISKKAFAPRSIRLPLNDVIVREVDDDVVREVDDGREAAAQ